MKYFTKSFTYKAYISKFYFVNIFLIYFDNIINMDKNISSRIYELRQEKNITQAVLAKEIGVTQKAIDFWEKGINEPKASYIIKLSQYFDVTTDYLLGLED